MTLLTIQPHAPRTIGAADPTEATISELTHQLFDGHDRDRLHGAWRGLIANEEFHYRPGLSTMERTALSYERLRIINQSIDRGVCQTSGATGVVGVSDGPHPSELAARRSPTCPVAWVFGDERSVGSAVRARVDAADEGLVADCRSRPRVDKPPRV
jgi:hypothetical protein